MILNGIVSFNNIVSLSNWNLVNPLLGWFSFWGTYWIIESALPYDEKSQHIIPSQPVAKVVARNMMLSLPYALLLWNFTPDFTDYLVGSYLSRFLISVVIMDGWFYITHRLAHTKFFYKWHKQHHQFNIPYPLMAVYCSPLEALLCDVTAVGLPASILKMTGLELEIWMCATALHALIIHSTLVHGRDHNLHHNTNKYNFGLLSIFDRLFGTYK